MIVKCQRSLFTSDQRPGSKVLFYTEDRRRLWEGDISLEWAQHFGPSRSASDNRFFAEVEWPDSREPPTFIKRLPDQDWPPS
jgi:hypothetical protein